MDIQKTKPGVNNVANIFRVTKESQIDHIVTGNIDKITMVIFCKSDPNINIFMKRHLAKNFNQCIFVVAHIGKEFVADRSTYVKKFNRETLPYVMFLYDARAVYNIDKADAQAIIDGVTFLMEKLEAAKKSGQNKDNKDSKDGEDADVNIEENNRKMVENLAREYQLEKMEELRKLHELEELERLDKLKSKISKDGKSDRADKSNRSDKSDKSDKSKRAKKEDTETDSKDYN